MTSVAKVRSIERGHCYARVLYAPAGMEKKEALNFHAVRCDRVVKNVFEKIQKQGLKTEGSLAKIQ